MWGRPSPAVNLGLGDLTADKWRLSLKKKKKEVVLVSEAAGDAACLAKDLQLKLLLSKKIFYANSFYAGPFMYIL